MLETLAEGHQLWAGDCLDCIQQMDDMSIDLCVTDLPYGISFKSGQQVCKHPKGKRENIQEYFGKIRGDDSIPTEWLTPTYSKMKDGSALYAFCHWKTWGRLYSAVSDAGFSVKNMIVVEKSNHGMGDLKGAYAPKHELLMYAVKGKHKLRFLKRQPDVWHLPVKWTGSHKWHPNEKPLSWLELPIVYSSDAGDTVFDPFAGSASVAVACEKLDRRSISCEIDEEFCKVIRKRFGEICNHTSKVTM